MTTNARKAAADWDVLRPQLRRLGRRWFANFGSAAEINDQAESMIAATASDIQASA
jgi:hypothetical protein